MKKINILYAYTQIRPRGIWKPTSKLSWSYKTNATTSCCRYHKLWGNTYFIWYIISNYSITGDRYSRFNDLKLLDTTFPKNKEKVPSDDCNLWSINLQTDTGHTYSIWKNYILYLKRAFLFSFLNYPKFNVKKKVIITVTVVLLPHRSDFKQYEQLEHLSYCTTKKIIFTNTSQS